MCVGGRWGLKPLSSAVPAISNFYGVLYCYSMYKDGVCFAGRCRSLTKEFRERRNQTIDDGIIEINKLLIRMEKVLITLGNFDIINYYANYYKL